MLEIFAWMKLLRHELAGSWIDQVDLPAREASLRNNRLDLGVSIVGRALHIQVGDWAAIYKIAHIVIILLRNARRDLI